MKTKNPRQIEMHNKEMYDRYGREYQKGRNEKWKSRLYNEYLEVPNMIKAVGKMKTPRAKARGI